MAESADNGVTWSKPSLRLHQDTQGSTDNNIVLPSANQFFPFVDTAPGVPPAERYKANQIDVLGVGKRALTGLISADGLHWEALEGPPIVPYQLENNFDSQNIMFFSEVEQQYVLFARHMEPGTSEGRRASARATSLDFRHWSTQVPMKYSDSGGTIPSAQLYTCQAQPYFRAPHLYLSLPGRIFFADPQHVTEADKSSVLARAAALASGNSSDDIIEGARMQNPKAGAAGDLSDGVLLSCRAGDDTWDFEFQESFVRPGIGPENWTSRNNYPLCGLVQTSTTELSFYVQRHYGLDGAHISRCSLRLDPCPPHDSDS
jgi:hypothetical protein